MKTQIRNIEKEDIEELSYIFVDAYKAEKTGENWTIQSARDIVEYWLNRSPADMKIAAVNQEGRILGAFLADIKPWWDGPHMIDGEFFVRTHAQGKGIGKMLIAELLTRAHQNHNATCFETITFEPDSEHPLKWYLSIGFEKVDNLVVINGVTEKVLEQLRR